LKTNLPRVSEKVCHFYFDDNFGNSGPIFNFFSLLISERICRGSWIKTIPPL